MTQRGAEDHTAPHSEEYKSVEHALAYLSRADKIPHRVEGEAALLEYVPAGVRRVLDVGTGDGRLLSLVLLKCPDAAGVGLDFSPLMLENARKRFAPRIEKGDVRIFEHDLARPLPDVGEFDVVCSCFAIHHLPHERKRSLYAEVFALLREGGVFANLEHVASPTAALHEEFFAALGLSVADEDKSNILLDMETQLAWLREIGFTDVDCHWKWRELALLVGRRARP